MSDLSAWRPLKDAPKVWSEVVVRGLGMTRVASFREGDGEDVKRWRVFNEPEISPLIEPLWEYAPIADTYELDRAVQGEIARAFGELIGRLADEADCANFRHWGALAAFRDIIHTAMGGRIPDEVP